MPLIAAGLVAGTADEGLALPTDQDGDRGTAGVGLGDTACIIGQRNLVFVLHDDGFLVVAFPGKSSAARCDDQREEHGIDKPPNHPQRLTDANRRLIRELSTVQFRPGLHLQGVVGFATNPFLLDKDFLAIRPAFLFLIGAIARAMEQMPGN
jgi:hypothetical protein